MKKLLLIFTALLLLYNPVYASDEVVKDNAGAEILFVGDSRAVGMSKVQDGHIAYIGKVGAGFEWFKNTALRQIDEFSDRGMILVINMGVNDPGNRDKYISLINSNKEKWENEGFTVCFASVNPVIDGCSNATEKSVKTFNRILKENLCDVWYMDSYGYLKKNGFDTVDGLHYTLKTYEKLADYYERYADKVQNIT